MNVTVGECAFPNMEGAVGFELGLFFGLFGPLLVSRKWAIEVHA
jgi:hypothetical protein